LVNLTHPYSLSY